MLRSLSDRAFLGWIILAMSSGLVMVLVAPLLLESVSIPLRLIGGLLAFILGFEISSRYPHWRVSLFGMLMSQAGVASVLSPLRLPHLNEILEITLSGMMLLFVLAMVRPRLLASWRSAALTSVASSAIIFLLVESGLRPSAPLASHFVGLGVLVYLDHYLSRAFSLPRTADNIVDTSCAVIVDALNQVLRLIARA